MKESSATFEDPVSLLEPHAFPVLCVVCLHDQKGNFPGRFSTRDDDPNTLTPEPDKLALSYFELELLCFHQTSFVNEIQLYMTMISLNMGISQQAMSDVYPFQ